MRPSNLILSGIAAACCALLGLALYLQLVEDMLPCPLCVLQRYAFILVALFCLLALRANVRLWSTLAALAAALGGAGVALYHVWVLAHPALSCGTDPLETALNRIPPAQWLPVLFRADGLCETPYDPILGLSIPAWALVWFVTFALLLAWVARNGLRRAD